MSPGGTDLLYPVVLHLSDVHFGAPDHRAEMARILEGAVRAASTQEWKPDLCIFSGDIVYSGSASEFSQASAWLGRLIEKWPDLRLFFVPGNHDVCRTNAKLFLRQCDGDEATYTKFRSQLEKDVAHLDQFFDWHSEIKKRFPQQVVSDWSNPFGCHNEITIQGYKFHLIGLNTALLSCQADDAGKLVQDIATLNSLLDKRAEASECVIAVGHHPLSWLTPWNSKEVETLLHQIPGANFYFHGHNHVHSSDSMSSSQGKSLTTLAGGALYQGSQWSQHFAFYEFDFDSHHINPRIFTYLPIGGVWKEDKNLSFSFVASLPRHAKKAPADAVKSGAIPVVAGRPVKTSETHTAGDDGVELDAHRAIKAANFLIPQIGALLDPQVFKPTQIYAYSSRAKSLESIVDKVARRRKKDPNYTVKRIDDICGFRFVTIFQSDIPVVIEKLLSIIPKSIIKDIPLHVGGGITVTIHTSRPTNDPLSISQAVEEVLRRWGGIYNIEYRSPETGYSSVHVVVPSVTCPYPGDPYLPVEFQIRSGLEEFWGQLDHKLRYGIKRGAVGDDLWQRHLNVLKTLFDATLQYVDLIKENAEAPVKMEPQESRQEPLSPTTYSISTPDHQLSLLKGLPPTLYLGVKKAFDLWKAADKTRRYGGVASQFREAADAFSPYISGCPSDVSNLKLRETLSYIATMERAYMLMSTGELDNLEQARIIYVEILSKQPEGVVDASAHFRLGQTLSEQGDYVAAVEEYNQSIAAIDNRVARGTSLENKRTYDFVRLSLAKAYWRLFEISSDKAKQDEEIKRAIQLVGRVLEENITPEAQRQALNDFVYYIWEERNLWRDAEEKLSISFETFCKNGSELAKLLEVDENATYRELDTLVRLYKEMANHQKAKGAAQKVCLELEQAARARDKTGKLSEVARDRFNPSWAVRVGISLINDDERDSLEFALDVLNQP